MVSAALTNAGAMMARPGGASTPAGTLTKTFYRGEDHG
jgi:hypothetical protein